MLCYYLDTTNLFKIACLKLRNLHIHGCFLSLWEQKLFSALVSPAERRALFFDSWNESRKKLLLLGYSLFERLWNCQKTLRTSVICRMIVQLREEKELGNWWFVQRVKKRSFFLNIFVKNFHNRKLNEINENQRVIVGW